MRYLIKFTLIVILGVFCLGLVAQDLSLDQLKAPAMPAANIITKQINEISRPTSFKDLQAAFLNNFLDSTNSFSLPNNFALEANPYLLGRRTSFSYTDYLENKFGKNIWEEFNVSLATTNNFLLNDSVSTNAIGLGLRTTLLRGKVNEELKSAYNKALMETTSSNNIKSGVGAGIDRYINLPGTTYSVGGLYQWLLENLQNISSITDNGLQSVARDYLKAVFQKIPANTPSDKVEEVFNEIYDNDIADVKLKKFRELIANVKTDRYGWHIDLNYARAFNFPQNNWDNAITSRWGTWVNVAYRPQKRVDKVNQQIPSNFEFIFLARVISVNQSFIDEYQPISADFREGNNYDLGLRAVYDTQKFSFELEYIQRWNRKKITQEINGQEFFAWQGDNTNKFILNMNYNVSKDIVISYNIGKNYDSAFTSAGSLISGLTINFGFGGYKLKDLVAAAAAGQ